ncbi:MAG: LysE family translocator [Chloroflexota bacterium]
MPQLVNLSLFVTASLALLLTPGPAVMYIVTRSVDQGRKAGFVSVLGIEVGTLFHIAAAALGLSALLASSALLFDTVKYLGAAYLIYMGIRKLLSKDGLAEVEINKQQNLPQIFRQGVIVNVLNPKTALFFLAFLPQFVDPARGSVPVQMLMLGLIFVLLASTTDGMYALLAGTFGGWLKSSTHFLKVQRYVTGTVYIGLGVVTALAGSNKK